MNARSVLGLSLMALCLCSGPSMAKETLAGDINGDGKVNIGDAVLALRVAIGLVPLDDGMLMTGDVVPMPGIGAKAGWTYGDGKVTVTDARRILLASIDYFLPENQAPPRIDWQGTYTPLDSGDAVLPDVPVQMTFVWEAYGPPKWYVDPAEAATLWQMEDERSALIVGYKAGTNFSVRAGSTPFTVSRFGATRDGLPAPQVELTITTDLTDYPPLRPPVITVKAVNTSDAPFTSGAGISLFAFDNEPHEEVWETKDLNWTQKVELSPHGEKTWTFNWDWKDNHGVFVQPRPFTLFARLGLGDPFVVFSKGHVITRIAVE